MIAHKKPHASPANNKYGRALVVDSTPAMYVIIEKIKNILFFIVSPLVLLLLY
jgi:hypothetical protein